MFVLCILGLCFFSSCEKENDGLVMKAYIDDSFSDAKVHLSSDNYTVWDDGDRLRINNERTDIGAGIYEVSVSGSTFSISGVKKNGSGYRAVYPYTLGTVSAGHYYQMQLHAIQTYNPNKIPIPMVAYTMDASSGLHFRAVTALMCVRVIGNIKVNSIQVTASAAALCGKGEIQGNDAAPVLVLNSETSNTVTLDCGDGVQVTDQKDFYIIIPAISDASNKFTITITGTGVNHEDGEYVYGTFSRTQPSSASGAIERSALGVVPFDVNNAAVNVTVSQNTGRLCGKFKVSSDGRFVNFSMGNLQHENGTWSFADHQYSYLGSANETNITTNGKIDLFGWGTSGNSYSPYNYYGNADESNGYYPYGLSNITKTSNDWGWHNAISNGGNVSSQWYTLTSAQWTYILANHTNKRASVAGVYGLIILPYGMSTEIANSYTADTWKTLAASGAVFLPAAGYRNGSQGDNNASVTSPGSRGAYWTGTFSGNQAAYYMGFSYAVSPEVTNSNASMIQTPTRYRGLSVRLVADAQ